MILDDFKRVESSNAIRYGSAVDISNTTDNSKRKGLPPSTFSSVKNLRHSVQRP